MAIMHSSNLEKNTNAVDFILFGVDGLYHTLTELKGEYGTLVMFICNHCPYVLSIIDKLLKECKEMRDFGISSIAIMPNDTLRYPQDAFSKMVDLANQKKFSFPYLIDNKGMTAAKYGATCTPDFFGFNADLKLQYRGKFDDSGKETQNDMQMQSSLFEAMQRIAETGHGPAKQDPSKGCSIKW